MTVSINAAEFQALKAGFDPVAERSTSLPSRAYLDPSLLGVHAVHHFHSLIFEAYSRAVRA
jgi:hypothetical protein